MQIRSELNTYIVSFESAMALCDCFDWQKYCLPCKHVLAVVTRLPGFSWDSIPEQYRNFPLFVIDSVISNNTPTLLQLSLSSEEQTDSVTTSQLVNTDPGNSTNVCEPL